MLRPEFCVLTAAGINCEEETATGLRRAGAEAEIVHMSQLASGDRRLSRYQGLVIPGGFSEGDAVRAGAVLAAQLRQPGLGDQIDTFVSQEYPVLGICNGFQVLVNMGLLPGGRIADRPQASLTRNTTGRFACKWVDLQVNTGTSNPLLATDLPESISLPVANGEGRFRADEATLDCLEACGGILMQYSGEDPSGADRAIAAIAVGTVAGMMPHPERAVDPMQFDNWRRMSTTVEPYGLTFLRGIVSYAAQC